MKFSTRIEGVRTVNTDEGNLELTDLNRVRSIMPNLNGMLKILT
jgi:hypothetical protein